ncbi:hypothetical protein HDU97_009300, partial [Phlyctochytrium planicorne]
MTMDTVRQRFYPTSPSTAYSPSSSSASLPLHVMHPKTRRNGTSYEAVRGGDEEEWWEEEEEDDLENGGAGGEWEDGEDGVAGRRRRRKWVDGHAALEIEIRKEVDGSGGVGG